MLTAITPQNQPIIWPSNVITQNSTAPGHKTVFTGKDLGIFEVSTRETSQDLPSKEEEVEFYRKAYSAA